jgi:hypothetical protein
MITDLIGIHMINMTHKILTIQEIPGILAPRETHVMLMIAKIHVIQDTSMIHGMIIPKTSTVATDMITMVTRDMMHTMATGLRAGIIVTMTTHTIEHMPVMSDLDLDKVIPMSTLKDQGHSKVNIQTLTIGQDPDRVSS